MKFVPAMSKELVDRSGHLTVATTDPTTFTVALSKELLRDREFLNRVLVHELGHVAMISFHLLDDIHRLVRKECWIEAEEWMCNFIADYGRQIYAAVYDILGDMAWLYVPGELERLLA